MAREDRVAARDQLHGLAARRDELLQALAQLRSEVPLSRSDYNSPPLL